MVVLSKCWPVLVYEAYCANMRRYMTMVRDFVSHGIYPFNRIDGGELSTDTSVLWSIAFMMTNGMVEKNPSE